MYLRYRTVQVTYVATAHTRSPEAGDKAECKGKKERVKESMKEEEWDEKGVVGGGGGEGEEPIVFFFPPAGFISVSKRMKEREKERNNASDDR